MILLSIHTGQRCDSGLALYDYRARYYDPLLGRFLSADPVVPEPGNPQALNRYAYVSNNPLKYTDPSGHSGALPPLLRVHLSFTQAYPWPPEYEIFLVRAFLFVLGAHTEIDDDYLVVYPSLTLPVGADFVIAPVPTNPLPSRQVEAASHTEGVAPSALPVRQKMEVVFSGHGKYRVGSGMVTVPEGTEVVTYSKFGGGITDRLGNAIETGQIPPGTYAKVWRAGQKMPDYTLYPPDGLTIKGNPVTVQTPTLLSDLLKPNMGRVHWAACTTAPKVKWTGYMWDIGGKVWIRR